MVNEKKIDKFNQDYILILIWQFKNYVIDKIKKQNKNKTYYTFSKKLKLIRDFFNNFLDKFYQNFL